MKDEQIKAGGGSPLTESRIIADRLTPRAGAVREVDMDSRSQALKRWEAAVSERYPEEYKALTASERQYVNVTSLFLGAHSQAELDLYLEKTPDRLREIAAQIDAAVRNTPDMIPYRRGDACEDALRKYELALPEEDRKALWTDTSRYDTLSWLFFGADFQAELDSYMDKTPAQLAEIAARKKRDFVPGVGDPCVEAFQRYEEVLRKAFPEEYIAFKTDTALFDTVCSLFYRATSLAELDSYMDKTPAQLLEIVAEKVRKYA